LSRFLQLRLGAFDLLGWEETMVLLRDLLRRFWRFEPDISEIDDHTLSDIGLSRIGLPMAED